MKYTYPVILTNDGGKVAVQVPDLKGCYTFGDNKEDALAMAKDAIEMYLVSMEDNDEEIPIPTENMKDAIYVAVDTNDWRAENNKKVKRLLKKREKNLHRRKPLFMSCDKWIAKCQNKENKIVDKLNFEGFITLKTKYILDF